MSLIAAAASCRSSRTYYYTLVAPPDEAATMPTDELQLDVLPVEVPPEVDRAEIVIRESRGQLTPVDTRAWISPLPRELRRAFSNELAHDLGARDIAGVTPAEGTPTYRVKLAVLRFEAELGKRTVVDATSTVREAAGAKPTLVCSHRVHEVASAGYDGIAEAYQRALAKIAKQVAGSIRSLRAGAGACTP
ncbi:MAG: PqiC family protein [Kofleriaceae bacterium]